MTVRTNNTMKHGDRNAEMIRRLEEDPRLSMRALSRETGLSHELIRQIWNLAHPGERRKHHAGSTPVEREEDPELVRRLDEDHRLSMTLLAEEMGTNRHRIAVVWRRAHPGETRPSPSSRVSREMRKELGLAGDQEGGTEQGGERK